METKQIFTQSGRFVDVVDCWYCPECGYRWGGRDRAPPHPHCPEC